MATLAANASGQNVWSGMAVQWDLSTTGAGAPHCSEAACEVTEMLPVPVTTKKFRPNLGQARRFWPKSPYGNEGRFAILGLRGKLTSVAIHGAFSSKEDLCVAVRLTRHELSNSGRDMWRRVTQTPQSSVTAGWATVEHPELQTDEECTACDDIVAFFVEIIEGVSAGSGASNLKSRLKAYVVLYLRPVKVYGFEDSFERVGVGRLFGENFGTLYRDADLTDIWLV